MGSTPHSVKASLPMIRHALSARSLRALALAVFLGFGAVPLMVLSAQARGPDTFADLAESVSDAVVNISAT